MTLFNILRMSSSDKEFNSYFLKKCEGCFLGGANANRDQKSTMTQTDGISQILNNCLTLNIANAEPF